MKGFSLCEVVKVFTWKYCNKINFRNLWYLTDLFSALKKGVYVWLYIHLYVWLTHIYIGKEYEIALEKKVDIFKAKEVDWVKRAWI